MKSGAARVMFAAVGLFFAQGVNFLDDQVHDFMLFLEFAADHPDGRAAADIIEFFPSVRVDDQVGLPSFVFQGHKGDAFGSPRSLPQNDQTTNSNLELRGAGQFLASHRAPTAQPIAMKGHRVPFER